MAMTTFLPFFAWLHAYNSTILCIIDGAFSDRSILVVGGRRSSTRGRQMQVNHESAGRPAGANDDTGSQVPDDVSVRFELSTIPVVRNLSLVSFYMLQP